MRYETLWSFLTANFTVSFDVAPEDMDPADSFEFDDDIEAVRSGSVEWFQARVMVTNHNDDVVGTNYLGACAYTTLKEFYTAHRDHDPMNRNCSIMRAARGGNVAICHYFPDMVTQAVREARETIARRNAVYSKIHA